LIWAGAILIVLDLIANLYNGFGAAFRFGPAHVVGFNFGNAMVMLVSSVSEGGVLMGLGKIIEVLQKK
jgi:hypothetical protein